MGHVIPCHKVHIHTYSISQGCHVHVLHHIKKKLFTSIYTIQYTHLFMKKSGNVILCVRACCSTFNTIQWYSRRVYTCHTPHSSSVLFQMSVPLSSSITCAMDFSQSCLVLFHICGVIKKITQLSSRHTCSLEAYTRWWAPFEITEAGWPIPY